MVAGGRSAGSTRRFRKWPAIRLDRVPPEALARRLFDAHEAGHLPEVQCTNDGVADRWERAEVHRFARDLMEGRGSVAAPREAVGFRWGSPKVSTFL
jgi:hypothetical protein